MVSIEKPVKATPALLLALRCFRQNHFGDRRDRLSFSLSEQLYAAHFQASHRSQIFLSNNHHAAIQKSISVLATFYVLQKCGDLKGKSLEENCNIVSTEKQNALGVALSMRHSADLKEGVQNLFENGIMQGGILPCAVLRHCRLFAQP